MEIRHKVPYDLVLDKDGKMRETNGDGRYKKAGGKRLVGLLYQRRKCDGWNIESHKGKKEHKKIQA